MTHTARRDHEPCHMIGMLNNEGYNIWEGTSRCQHLEFLSLGDGANNVVNIVGVLPEGYCT